MKTNKTKFLALILMTSILLSGCGAGQFFGPTLTPTSTPTLTPTFTPTSTSTPTPTFTPTFTPTPTVAPPLSAIDYLINPVIDRIDTFESSNAPAWDLTAGHIENGALVVTGDGNWNGLMIKRQFLEGQGVVFSYKMEKGREWSPYFYNGVGWGTSEYLQLGIFDPGYPRLDIYKGKNLVAANNLKGNFRPKLDTWYQVMMVLGNDAHFLVVISDPSDPTRSIVYQEIYDTEWAGISWYFRIIVNQAVLKVDDFMEVSFSDIKK